jgi:hypothetical protein
MATTEQEHDAASLRQEQEVKLARALFDDPETGPEMQKLIAKKFPTAKSAMPALVAREAVDQGLAEVRKEREEFKKELRAEQHKRELQAARDAIKNDPALRISDEEIAHVEKLMVDETIGSHSAAARLYRSQQQVGVPRSGPSAMQVPGVKGAGGDDFKGLVDDPDGWARAKAYDIIGDFQNGQGAKWQ